MSFKSKMLAGAASLALASGLAVTGGLGGLSAHAATPSCGPGGIDPVAGPFGCVNVFNRQFGTHRHPNFILDVLRQGARVGQPIILFRATNSDPAEDFVVSLSGTGADFASSGLLSSVAAKHWGADPAFELEYSPYGVQSGLCVGLFGTAVRNEGVTLQPCGVSSKTVWILDTFDLSFPAAFHGYFPLINGSNTNFSHPFVLTYPANGYPTDVPRPQLKVTNLTGFSNGFGPIVGTVVNSQLWSGTFGVIP